MTIFQNYVKPLDPHAHANARIHVYFCAINLVSVELMKYASDQNVSCTSNTSHRPLAIHVYESANSLLCMQGWKEVRD